MASPTVWLVNGSCISSPRLDHDLFSLRLPMKIRSIDVAVLHHPHREKGWEVVEQALTLLSEQRPETSIVVFGRR
jgi:hypothetical protein